ncbi:MAG TPA: hypothetical protein VLF66_06270, partial [Thermoanaerobaculia bacterium]|nr:hypothetical protein [Thermoanaerobaculia bacterium]
MRRRSPARPLSPLALLLGVLLLALGSLPALAQGPPCRPCGGVIVDDPGAAAAAIGALSDFEERHPIYVAWDVATASAPAEIVADVEASRRLREVGATPWTRLVFTTPPPLIENTEALNAELETAAALARDAAEDTHFQVVWRPSAGEAEGGTAPGPVEAAFLIKRASVALTGARTEATVVVGPWPADPAFLRELYGQDVAAYLDGLALEAAPLDRIEAAVAELAELDPGRPVVIDALPLPEQPSRALARAAELAVRGAAVAFFELPSLQANAAAFLAPFVALATDFRGDLSYDPQLGPAWTEGDVTGAWSFVRGEDLGVRTIVELPASAAEPTPDPAAEPLFGPETTLRYPDPTLLSPDAFDPATAEPRALFGTRRDPEGISVPVPADRPVWLLRLERGQAVDLEQYEERLTVAGERRIPVEEILRRLQAFEDAQARRLGHYSATNTTHLRFGSGAGQGNVEATLEGAFFFRQPPGEKPTFDWAWQRFLINGVRWRGERIPEIPLVQPEKAATLPIEITFTRQY